MIIVCSSAKTFRKAKKGSSVPLFIDDAKHMVSKLVFMDLKSYFKLSDSLDVKVRSIYDKWSFEGLYNVLDCFYGLQFKQIDSTNLSVEQREYADKHLYVLSGLYGILRCSDSICEYRLDGYDKIDGISMNDHYHHKVNDYLKSLNEEILDLSSQEYSMMLDDYVKVNFLVGNKSNGTINKIQRGKMIRYCIEHNIDKISDIKQYAQDGFKYDEKLSNDKLLVFSKE